MDAAAEHGEVALRYRPNDTEARRLLEQVKPFLVVTSRPSGAQVLLDGRSIGTTSGEGLRYSEVARNRSYRVEARLKGHYAPSQEVRLAKFGRVPLHFALKESALPPGWEQAFVVPTQEWDQYGNPVVTRNGRSTDPQTGHPWEIWLKQPRVEFVLIPPGKYMMGSKWGFLGMGGEKGRQSNERQHEVRLTKPFYLAKYEVTQGQWRTVMVSSPWSGKGNVKEDPRSPAAYVSWDNCQEFLKKLGPNFRLPTEAEWEYACRAGSSTAYCFGNDTGRLKEHAWYHDNAYDIGEKYGHAVGSKRANAWGMYDMHGNEWEWCQDWYGDYQSGSASDPTGPVSGSGRVARGGSFAYIARGCRSAHRSRGLPGDSSGSDLGFRPSVSLP